MIACQKMWQINVEIKAKLTTLLVNLALKGLADLGF